MKTLFNLQNPCKKLGLTVYTCNVIAGEAKTGGSLEVSSQPAKPGPQRVTLSQKLDGWPSEKTIPEVDLQPPHV